MPHQEGRTPQPHAPVPEQPERTDSPSSPYRGRPIESFRADLVAHFDRWRDAARQTPPIPNS
jgi:hypothetical protein